MRERSVLPPRQRTECAVRTRVPVRSVLISRCADRRSDHVNAAGDEEQAAAMRDHLEPGRAGFARVREQVGARADRCQPRKRVHDERKDPHLARVLRDLPDTFPRPGPKPRIESKMDERCRFREG